MSAHSRPRPSRSRSSVRDSRDRRRRDSRSRSRSPVRDSQPARSNSCSTPKVIAIVSFLVRDKTWISNLDLILSKIKDMELHWKEIIWRDLLEAFLLLANGLAPHSSNIAKLASSIQSLSRHRIDTFISLLDKAKRLSSGKKDIVHILLRSFGKSAGNVKMDDIYNRLCRPLVEKLYSCKCEDSGIININSIGIKESGYCDLESLLAGKSLCAKICRPSSLSYKYHSTPSTLVIGVYRESNFNMNINDAIIITDVNGVQHRYVLDSLVYYDKGLGHQVTAIYQDSQLFQLSVCGTYQPVPGGLLNQDVCTDIHYLRYKLVGRDKSNTSSSSNISYSGLSSSASSADNMSAPNSQATEAAAQHSTNSHGSKLNLVPCSADIPSHSLSPPARISTVSSYQAQQQSNSTPTAATQTVPGKRNHDLAADGTILQSGTVKRSRVSNPSVQTSGNNQHFQSSGSSSFAHAMPASISTAVINQPSLSDSIQQVQASNRELANRIQRYASQRVHPRLGNSSVSDSSTTHSTQQQQQQQQHSSSHEPLPGYKNMVCYIAKQETVSDCEPNIDDGMLYVACVNLRDINGVAASEQISKQLSQCHAIGFTEFSSEAYEEIKLLCGDSVTVLRNGRVGIAIRNSNAKSVVQVPIAIDEFVDVYGKNLSESVRTSIKADIHSRLALFELTLICGTNVHIAVFYYHSNWAAHIDARRVFGNCIRYCLKNVQLHSLYIGIGDINSAAHWLDRYRHNLLGTTEEQHRNVQHYRNILKEYSRENKHHCESVLEPLAEVGLYDPVHLARCLNMPTSSADIHHRFSFMKNNQPVSAIDCCFVPVHLLPECVISYGIGSGLWPYLDHLALGVSISLKQADAIGTTSSINIPQSYFELPPVPQNHIIIRRPINYMETTTRFKFTIVNSSNSSLSMTSAVTRTATPHLHPPAHVCDGLFLQGKGPGYSAVDSSSNYKALLIDLGQQQQPVQQSASSATVAIEAIVSKPRRPGRPRKSEQQQQQQQHQHQHQHQNQQQQQQQQQQQVQQQPNPSSTNQRDPELLNGYRNTYENNLTVQYNKLYELAVETRPINQLGAIRDALQINPSTTATTPAVSVWDINEAIKRLKDVIPNPQIFEHPELLQEASDIIKLIKDNPKMTIMAAVAELDIVPTEKGGWKSYSPSGRLHPRLRRCLNKWLDDNSSNPNPLEEEKEKWAKIAGVNVEKIGQWFIYARKRNRQKTQTATRTTVEV
ncbi:hypothetical protein GQ42DRAFT_15570 [Ramicandelaber brevisporus]|nr:hypothetical protein GQ42DRAFT_15570 [Ramicandelaber brevisporus]